MRHLLGFLSLLLTLLLLLPLLAIVSEASLVDGEYFNHIKQTVLSQYLLNTVLLMIGVLIFSALIGVPLAWWIANCEFYGRRLMSWALVLPLAMPSYIVAFTYTDLFDYAGPVQVALRDLFGWQTAQDYWFFDLRTLGGAVIVLSLVLFPYIYLMARASFMLQPDAMNHAARTLGKSPWQSFISVSLPLARPAIVAGCALVAMETVADFATVHYFSVNTLTTAIYDTWLGYYDLASAAKLSALMVVGMLLLLALERWQLGQRQTVVDSKVGQNSKRYCLTRAQTVGVLALCWSVLIAAFFLPAAVLLYYSVGYFDQAWHPMLWQYSLNSLYIALFASVLAVLSGYVINSYRRQRPSLLSDSYIKMSSTGYALPGTVLAIGVLIPTSWLDGQLNELALALNIEQPGLLLSGTLIAIVLAHWMRFSAIAVNNLSNHYDKIPPSLDMAARTLGLNRWQLFKRVHWPLLKKGSWVAGLLIFVESMKELPAALLLRPFDFQTLPTYVYQFASDEQIEVAALGALIIVVVGMLPLLVANRSIEQK